MDYRRDSFIRNKELIDRRFLDLNKLPVVPVTSVDEQYTIEDTFNKRPDLLAYSVYGNARLWWVIILRNINLINDPIEDFTAGKTIMLPAPETVNKLTG